MARPTNRREWLESFLWLVDRNRPAREFRTKLGIKTPELAKKIADVGALRSELQMIYDVDKVKVSKVSEPKAAMTKPLPRPSKLEPEAPAVTKKTEVRDSWRKARKAKKEVKNESIPTADSDSKTVGPREDSSKD